MVSVQSNQFGTTNKANILHGTLKAALPDLSEPSEQLFGATQPYMQQLKNPWSYRGN